MAADVEWSVRSNGVTWPAMSEDGARNLFAQTGGELLHRELPPWTVVETWTEESAGA